MNTSSVDDLDGNWSIDCASKRCRICVLPTCGCPHHRDAADAALSSSINSTGECPSVSTEVDGECGTAATDSGDGSDRGDAVAVPRIQDDVAYVGALSGRLKAS